MQMLIHKLTDETCDLEAATPLYAKHISTYVHYGYLNEIGEYWDGDDVEEFTAYRIFGETWEDEDEAAEMLSRAFWDMCEECGIEFGNDRPALSEAFNAWTDSLCKDGDICGDSYERLAVIDRAALL
ncbi:hypothetical protein GQE99_06615 [Maritimibacter sp. DP07]|uniref:Uncharacterized protein n=1 Tax=Maritimibacter harenae TaxID=2606218 RepID=A0A845M0N1_9RHOB|nr:hypothetical protein [Maritimibacter harenae]MZR12692.1 hypothetical protein [Maritimibacter harenae]